MKFRAYPYHLGLLVLNDSACLATCFPMYALWAKNDYHNYFDKVEETKSAPTAESKAKDRGVG